jgi:hypothetical protein
MHLAEIAATVDVLVCNALAELSRVIRPGGELRLYEHVLAKNPRWATRQRRAAPIWRHLGGGCNPDRDTRTAIATAGFDTERCRELLFYSNPGE